MSKNACAALCGVLALALVQPVRGQNISTVDAWDGNGGIGWIGGNYGRGAGQTFTVGNANVLNSFSFWFRDNFGDQDNGLVAYVMGWSGTRATGGVLWNSSPFTVKAFSPWQRYDFFTGALNLQAGAKYVAFVSVGCCWVTRS